MQFFLITLNLASLTLVLPVIILFLNRQPIVYKWLVVCLLFSFLIEMIAKILVGLGINPNIGANVYAIFSTIPITIFFYYAINSKKLKSILVLLNIFYFSFAVVNFFFLQKSAQNSYSTILQSFIILALSIAFFFKLLKHLPTTQVQKDPLFWIVSGLFFSYSGKLVIYGISFYMISVIKDNLILIWTIHNLLSIIGYSLVFVGAFLQFKRSRMVREKM